MPKAAITKIDAGPFSTLREAAREMAETFKAYPMETYETELGSRRTPEGWLIFGRRRTNPL